MSFILKLPYSPSFSQVKFSCFDNIQLFRNKLSVFTKNHVDEMKWVHGARNYGHGENAKYMYIAHENLGLYCMMSMTNA